MQQFDAIYGLTALSVPDFSQKAHIMKFPFSKLSVNRAPARSLQAFTYSGSNPGDLTAYTYVPQQLRKEPPLVVVLHGCTQDAAVYDTGSGWSQLADEYGFALLYPQQQHANNPNLCFNWFKTSDTGRNKGEAASIAGMIREFAAKARIDTDRIYITGLSAGGAMTAAMLATYPDIFEAGAVIAGLPFGAAEGVPQALAAMSGRGSHNLAKTVRRIQSNPDSSGVWPRLSVWHGNADTVVVPENADALVAQWIDLNGLDAAPSQRHRLGAHSCDIWKTRDGGRTLLERWNIAAMGHGVPLHADDDISPLGAVGAHMLNAGISSTRHIAKFFGILDTPAKYERPPVQNHMAKTAFSAGAPALVPPLSPRFSRQKDDAPVSSVSGIQKTIEDALRSAGLMK